MRIYNVWAHYKTQDGNEAFDASFSKLDEARLCAIRLRDKDRAKHNQFDKWGIDVFDSKEDNYRRTWYLLREDGFLDTITEG